MNRRRIRQNDNTQEMHFEASLYLTDVIFMIKLGETPDYRTRIEWQKHRRELSTCSGTQMTSASGDFKSHAKHTELVSLVDDILEKLPELPDEYQLQKLSKYIDELSACREQMVWY